ncbi:MAG: efflux RND transporter periplasmic adaptor subunit [Bacteroidota bacterium]
MNQLRLFFGILLIALSSVLLISCGKSDAKENDETSAQEPPITVRVQEVQTTPYAELLNVTGIVKAYDDVMLSPEEGGVIKEWKVKKGESVSKGQVLATLKDDMLQASYDAALAQYKLAELNYSKQEKIYSEQAISELQFKSVEYNRDAAKAQADLALARLERARLRSPIDGILNDRFTDEGEFAPTAVPVAHLVNVGTVKIAAEVPERHFGAVSIGVSVRVMVEAAGNDTLLGKINFVGSAVSPNNRTLPVEIILPNKGRRLKPEMVARVQIIRVQRHSAILIGDDLVQQVDRNKLVVYVEKNGRAEERVVKIGSRQGTMVEVIDGLKPGDRVIIAGFQKLVHGQPVQVAG